MVDLVQRVGSEFRVNTTTLSVQQQPTITGLSNGGFVICWQCFSGTGDVSGYAVRAQLYNAAGTKVGTEFFVNTQMHSDQQLASVASLSNGGFVVSWQDNSGTLGDSSGTSIKAQVFSAAGAKVGSEFLVNSQTLNAQQTPGVTGLNNGGFVVTWADNSGTLGDTSAPSIKAQVFDAAGAKVGFEFLVNTQTSSGQSAPTITSLSSGGFVVTWQDSSGTLGDASPPSIKAQIFSAAGVKVGSEFLINTQSANAQQVPTITGLSDGGFVVAWQDASATLGDASGSSIKAQVFNAAGAKVGSEFLVNTQTSGDQQAPAITSLANGGFIVSWADGSGTGGDTSGTSIKAQMFDASGAKVGGEFLVNTATITPQQQPTIAGLSNGGFVVSWTDSSQTLGDASFESIKAQVYSVQPPPNTPPTASNDTLAAVLEDSGPRVITAAELLGNDSPGPAGEAAQTLSIASVGNATGGTVVLNADGTVTFTPTVNFNGPASFTYTARDSGGVANGGSDTSGPATVTFNVAPVNDAPVGSPTAVLAAGTEDTAYTVTTAQLIAGFSDVDAGSLSVTGLTADHGTVTANPDGSFTITPAANYNGPVGLSYGVTDGSATVAATQSFTLGAVEDAPTAAASASLTTSEDTAATGVAIGAVDADGDGLAYGTKAGAGPTKGTVTYDQANGTFNYTPDANANGADSFVIQVDDGHGGVAEQAVSVTITPVNDAPTAPAAASVSTSEDTATEATAIGAADLDGDTLTYQVKAGAGPAKGTVTFADGKFVYTPGANANGADSFTIQVTDGAATVEQLVSVSITPVNDAPTAAPTTSVTTAEDTATAATAIGAADLDGDALTYQVKTGDGPAKGTVTFADGKFVYTPGANANGADSFTIQVTDGTATVEQLVSVSITPVNDTPTAAGEAVSVYEDAVSENLWSLLLANDSDIESSTLTIVAAQVLDGVSGIHLDAAGRSLTFTADDSNLDALAPGETRVIRLEYTVADAEGATHTAIANVTVMGVVEPSGNGGFAGGSEGDVLQGGAAADNMNGKAGDDLMIGGLGADAVQGGKGSDTFHFDRVGDFGDAIQDMEVGDKFVPGDVVRLNVGVGQIEVGDNDTVIDPGELTMILDRVLTTADVTAAFNGLPDDGRLLLALSGDGRKGVATLWYDDPDSVTDPVIVCTFDNITSIKEIARFSESDFLFV